MMPLNHSGDFINKEGNGKLKSVPSLPPSNQADSSLPSTQHATAIASSASTYVYGGSGMNPNQAATTGDGAVRAKAVNMYGNRIVNKPDFMEGVNPSSAPPVQPLNKPKLPIAFPANHVKGKESDAEPPMKSITATQLALQAVNKFKQNNNTKVTLVNNYKKPSAKNDKQNNDAVPENPHTATERTATELALQAVNKFKQKNNAKVTPVHTYSAKNDKPNNDAGPTIAAMNPYDAAPEIPYSKVSAKNVKTDDDKPMHTSELPSSSMNPLTRVLNKQNVTPSTTGMSSPPNDVNMDGDTIMSEKNNINNGVNTARGPSAETKPFLFGGAVNRSMLNTVKLQDEMPFDTNSLLNRPGTGQFGMQRRENDNDLLNRMQWRNPQLNRPPTNEPKNPAINPAPLPVPKNAPIMRELKVEDALNYLDQVKFAFGDRPKIYNEFLEIMKNFKAHEIDTPGVIRRVSELFRGYNNLILGFNTFLPEGFKIEQKDLEVGGHLAGFSAPRPPPGPTIVKMSRLPQEAQNIGRGHLTGHNGNIFSSGQPQQQKQRMSQLPNGGSNLNVHQQQQRLSQLPNRGSNLNVQHQQPIGGNREPSGGFQGREIAEHPQQESMSTLTQPVQYPIPDNNQPPTHTVPVPQSMVGMRQQAPSHPSQQQSAGQQPEFDHAISYVTTIKRRFSNEPRTYQQFLEILHTYQKEQRGIREVLEQVSSLFADHPDLLKEFTYFLPEAVQEQAKERLHAAAAEAEARIFAQQQQKATQNAGFDPMTALFPKHQIDTGAWKEPTAQSKKVIDMTEKQLSAVEKQVQEEKPSPSQSRKRPHSPTGIPQQYSSYHMQPEALVYNAGVERQFFDAAKEALTSFSRDGELAWAEFIKCIDMYAQEIISKNEMLSIMEDLLGKQHGDLLDEYKRILTAAGAPGAHVRDDAWHSVPLSEIDFSRCRRCTPSYRALPRDYPCPPFSERSEEEAKVLNDVWISLPDGSEESYTFRHMRKNQHEEVLFRCEDERFEIDMVIDSNACTLQCLEPIAEEIAMLQKQGVSRKTSQGSNDNKSSNGGAGGKLYKYSFDKRILTTIHKHSISRIYGDAGAEILKLMYTNPVGAIPIVVKRLRQKDEDFRASRKMLNLRWKELAETNYYKSLDHRSLTWRTIDKRATSTRTLATDIKDRAANNGIESEAAIIAKRDKAKDEHGSFYEVTMGRYLSRKMDLSRLPKPSSTLFIPHMSITYDNNSWAQRDAYRIITFALERGPTSPTDKDRCHAVWRHFLSKLFGLSLMWMHGPAVAFSSSPPTSVPSVVSNGDDSGNDDGVSSAEENEMIGDDMVVTEEVMKDCEKGGTSNDNNQFHILDQQPIPPGALILTVYGEGTVIKFDRSVQMYEVSLPYGAVGYLNRNVVLCSILPIKKSSVTEQLMSSDEKGLERKDDMMILGPQCLYLFFRLHQILIRRLNIARKLAYSVDNDKTLSTLVEHITPDGNANIGQKRYEAFLSLVYGLVEGSYTSSFPGSSSSTAEGGKYEDRLRCLLGHNSYELATMDKLISHILKNLQNMANDNTMQEMIQIFRRQLANGGFKPAAFKQEAAMISEGENMFAFQYCKIPKSDRTIMHMEFLGCIIKEEKRELSPSNESNERGEGHPMKKQRRG